LALKKLKVMKTKVIIARKKARKYNGQPILKIKRIRTEPRQRIRQLLRSFVPLSNFIKTETSNHNNQKLT